MRIAALAAVLAACGEPQPGPFSPHQLPANLASNPSLINGDFEAGDLSVGWTTGGNANNSQTRVLVGSNHVAEVDVGAGPIGDAACTNPSLDNFSYIDQLFSMPSNRRVELDFKVTGVADPTENATCAGFDRIEIDFDVVVPDPFATLLFGAVLIDRFPQASGPSGMLIVNDTVAGAQSTAQFDPASFAPVSAGALSLEQSAAMPGFLHAAFDLSTANFPWLAPSVVFRVTVRNEDNGFTGQNFSVQVDNVAVTGGSGVRQVAIDVKPGSDVNPFNCKQAEPLIPVAILSSADFDATTVDASTVRFGHAGTEAAAVHGGHAEDVNGDGRADLVLQFRTGDTGLSCDDTRGVLTGKTAAGEAISGSDSMKPVPGGGIKSPPPQTVSSAAW